MFEYIQVYIKKVREIQRCGKIYAHFADQKLW